MNQVALIGRLGGDPEFRVTQSGNSVAKFRLAVNRVGSKEPDWFEIVAFGKVAESVSTHMRKGCRVGVSGRLQQEKWVDKDTNRKRSKVTVIAAQMDFIDWPGDNGDCSGDADGMDPSGFPSDVPF